MLKSMKESKFKKISLILLSLIFILNFINIDISASNDPCSPKMTVQQCVKAIEKEQAKSKDKTPIKSEKELDIYAKNLMSNKNELPNWYIQFNLDSFFMPTGSISGDLLGILSNIDLHAAKLVAFALNMISFFIYYITMFFINFVNGDTISSLITGIGKYINQDILNVNSDSGLAVKILFVIMIIAMIRGLATRDEKMSNLKSFLKYFFTLLFVAIFALQMARVNININSTMNSITKPIITSLVNDEKLAQNGIKGATLEQKLKNIIYENISLSQYVFQNFGTTTNNVDREEVRKLMTEENYADVLAENGNTYVISYKNKGVVLYYTNISSILRLTNTISGCFFELMLQTYQLTFNLIAQIVPIFSLIYIAINLSKGFSALSKYFFTVFLWAILSNIAGFVILIINLIISYTYNQFFGLNYFATLIFSIMLLIIGIWLFLNRAKVFEYMKKLLQGQINLAKSAYKGQPIMESVSSNIIDPIKEVGNDLRNQLGGRSKTEVEGDVGLDESEDENIEDDVITTTDTIDSEEEQDKDDLVDEGGKDSSDQEESKEESKESDSNQDDNIDKLADEIGKQQEGIDDFETETESDGSDYTSNYDDLVDSNAEESTQSLDNINDNLSDEVESVNTEESTTKTDSKEYLNNIDPSLIGIDEGGRSDDL